MTVPDNIETFNRICIALLDELYSAFPVPAEIDMDAISMSAVPQNASGEAAWDMLSMGGDVLRFLSQEGFLTHRHAALVESKFEQVRLTMKGLAILGYIPASIENSEGTTEPLSSKIRSVIGGGLKEAGGETVRQLVSQVFSLALAATPAVGTLLTGRT
jgi:hypothetical protein